MKLIKSSTLIVISLFFFLTSQPHQRAYATERLKPFGTANLLKKQWAFLTPHFNLWNGFWVRYDVSAKPIMSSSVMRNFTFINSTAVIQTNVYSNVKFRPSGSSPTWMYMKDTYDYPRTLPSALYLYGGKFGFGGSRNLGGSRYSSSAGVEKLFMHGNARVSLTSIYDYDASLKRMTVIRERKYPSSVSRGEALGSMKTMKLSGKHYVLRGVWARVHECIDRGYMYTKAYSFYRDYEVLLPSGKERFAYELAWRLSVSVPKMIGNKKMYSAFYMWRISARKVITGYTTYGRNGLFQKDCSSSFYKIYR